MRDSSSARREFALVENAVKDLRERVARDMQSVKSSYSSVGFPPSGKQKQSDDIMRQKQEVVGQYSAKEAEISGREMMAAKGERAVRELQETEKKRVCASCGIAEHEWERRHQEQTRLWSETTSD